MKNMSISVSPSTEHNDRGRKFFFYMQISELKEYILVDSTAYYVQAGRKQADGSWKFEDLRDLSEFLRIETTHRPSHFPAGNLRQRLFLSRIIFFSTNLFPAAVLLLL